MKLISLGVIFLILFSQTKKVQKKVPQYQFQQKAYLIPHPDKIEKGGQDAFYSGKELIVLSDGVGGWKNQNIDPSQYSRFLCSAAQVYYNQDSSYYDNNPIQLIAKAQKANKFMGSATMVVLALDQHLLKGCYIGDSGFIVIRQFKQKPLVIYEFTQLQHAFNFPYQLAMQVNNGDDPYESICVDIHVKQGDIIVAGSDGLFDNVYVDQILQTVTDTFKNQKQSSIFQLPKIFAEVAIQRGKNKLFVSPFQQRAEQLGLSYKGGKLDDTTVIVARIKNSHFEKIQGRQL